MQVGFFCKIKHSLLSSSNMGNIFLLVKNYFPFSIDFRISSYFSAWSSLSQKECRESLGRRKAAVLYWQSWVMPELRWDVPGTELFSLVRVSASSLSRWLWCCAVLRMLGERGTELRMGGNETVTALGSLSSPECNSCNEMCRERVREEWGGRQALISCLYLLQEES